MSELCPKTNTICPVRINLVAMERQARTPEEFLAVKALQTTVTSLLRRGRCLAPLSDALDIHGESSYCGNDRLPDVAGAVDDVEELFVGYTEIFEIENIGRVQGN